MRNLTLYVSTPINATDVTNKTYVDTEISNAIGDLNLVTGDIAYLSKKEFDGKLRQADGSLSVTGDLATLTANAGKDMYLAKATVVFYNNSASNPTVASKVSLLLNGVTVEVVASQIGLITESFQYIFVNLGKVATTQIIKLEVTAIDTNVDIEGSIVVFEEDTGTDPS